MTSLLFLQVIPFGNLIYLLVGLLFLVLIVYAVRVAIRMLHLPAEAEMLAFLILAIIVLAILWNQFAGRLF